MSRGGAPEGGAVVLDVAQLEALLTRTFSIGLDVGRGREKVALVRLRLSKALLGAAETQAMAAEALAIERGVATEQIAAAEGLALHAAAFNGMPDPVLHLAARAMGVVTGLAALEPDPRAPGAGVLLEGYGQDKPETRSWRCSPCSAGSASDRAAGPPKVETRASEKTRSPKPTPALTSENPELSARKTWSTASESPSGDRTLGGAEGRGPR